MIGVHVREPDSEEWKAWRQRAEDARQALMASVEGGAEPNVSNDLYKEQKHAILEFFHGKCAYCEVRITGSQPGDVEHFRPKKGLVGEDGKAVLDATTRRKHPGYYWLAYDWRNLLPSCRDCNRQPSKAQPWGKGNRFPVRAFRAFKPGQEVNEEPLLLNPLNPSDHRSPEEHLVFDDHIDDTGVVGGRTDEGKKTIEILGLNRDGIRDGRVDACSQLKGLILRLVSALVERSETAGTLQLEIEDYKAGKKPFSAAAQSILTRLQGGLEKI